MTQVNPDISIEESSKTEDDYPPATTTSYKAVVLTVLLVVLGLLGLAVYKGMGNVFVFAPLPDGSFPMYTEPLYFTIIKWSLIVPAAVLALVFTAETKHAWLKFIAVSGLLIAGILFGVSAIEAHGKSIWHNSFKSWVSTNYGIEYDSIEAFHQEGVFEYRAKHRFDESVYSDPPKDFQYLIKDGERIAELIPDAYRSGSVRVYEVSDSPTPVLMEVKK